MHIEQTIYAQSTLLTLQEAKDHLRVDVEDDDSLIMDCVRSATDFVQKYTNQLFLSGQYCIYLDEKEWENHKAVEVWLYPIISINSIKYINTSGEETTLDSANYTTDVVSYPARIMLLNKPAVKQNTFNQFRIYVTAGFIDKYKINPEIIGWVKIMVGFFYEIRQSEYTGVITSKINLTVERGLDKHIKHPLV